MEHIDISNLSLATLGAEIFRFVIRTTDLKDPVFETMTISTVSNGAGKASDRVGKVPDWPDIVSD